MSVFRARLFPLFVLGCSTCKGASDPGDPAGLAILTTSLPSAVASASYSASIVVQGGRAPYAWSVVAGVLPSGLTLNKSTGVISGTPAQEGTSSFTTQVRDASNATSTKQLQLTVENSSSGATVTIAPNGATHQTWRAWRYTVRNNRTSDASCTRFPDALVNGYLTDVVENLGFNGVRLEQHWRQALEGNANDNADPFSVNMAGFVSGLEAPDASGGCSWYARADLIDRTVIPMRNQVQARGEPFELYLSFVYFQFSRMPAWWRDNPQEAAEAVEAYVTWFKQLYGFAPDWFTYNEPDAAHFDSQRWMGKLTAALGPRFSKLGVSTKIEQPSPPNPYQAVPYFDNIAGVQSATPFIKRLSFHSYDYNNRLWPTASGIRDRNELRDRARAIGAETAMTEICCHQGWTGDYNTGLGYVRDIFLHMTEADVSVWEPLGIYNVCSASGCPVNGGSGQNLVNIDPGLTTYYLNPNFWVVRQFTRFIRPGYVRLGLNCSGCGTTSDRGPGVKAVAWLSPSNKVVVVLINDTPAPVTTLLSGLPSGAVEVNGLDPTRCVTSGPRNRCTPDLSTVSANGSITVTLPVGAVWTLRQT